MSLLWLSGCTQYLPSSETTTTTSILPVSDSRHLPDVIKALLKQSDTQYLNNDFTGSLATLERAIRINPRHAEVWSRMAQVYLKQGEFEQAREHAKRSNSVIKDNALLREFNNKIISSPLQDTVN